MVHIEKFFKKKKKSALAAMWEIKSGTGRQFQSLLQRSKQQITHSGLSEDDRQEAGECGWIPDTFWRLSFLASW